MLRRVDDAMSDQDEFLDNATHDVVVAKRRDRQISQRFNSRSYNADWYDQHIRHSLYDLKTVLAFLKFTILKPKL